MNIYISLWHQYYKKKKLSPEVTLQLFLDILAQVVDISIISLDWDDLSYQHHMTKWTHTEYTGHL